MRVGSAAGFCGCPCTEQEGLEGDGSCVLGSAAASPRGCKGEQHRDVHTDPPDHPQSLFPPVSLTPWHWDPIGQRDVAWPWPQQCTRPVLRHPRAINGKNPKTKQNPTLLSCLLQPVCTHSTPGVPKSPVLGGEMVVSPLCTPMGEKTPKREADTKPRWGPLDSAAPGAASLHEAGLRTAIAKKKNKLKLSNAKAELGEVPHTTPGASAGWTFPCSEMQNPRFTPTRDQGHQPEVRLEQPEPPAGISHFSSQTAGKRPASAKEKKKQQHRGTSDRLGLRT